MTNKSEIHHTKVGLFLERSEKPYDLVILDPPYADPDIIKMLSKVARSRLVQSGSVVAIGHSPRVTLPDRVGQMARLKERCHGDSCVSIYEIEDKAEGTANEDGDLSGQL